MKDFSNLNNTTLLERFCEEYRLVIPDENRSTQHLAQLKKEILGRILIPTTKKAMVRALNTFCNEIKSTFTTQPTQQISQEKVLAFMKIYVDKNMHYLPFLDIYVSKTKVPVAEGEFPVKLFFTTLNLPPLEKRA